MVGELSPACKCIVQASVGKQSDNRKQCADLVATNKGGHSVHCSCRCRRSIHHLAQSTLNFQGQIVCRGCYLIVEHSGTTYVPVKHNSVHGFKYSPPQQIQ